MKTIEVNAEALRQVLHALNGPEHYIRELQYTRGIDENNPINILMGEYSAAVEVFNEENN